MNGGLVVKPEYRHQGVGYRLIYSLIQHAMLMGFEELYAFTQEFDASLKRHHFQYLDTVEYGGEPYRVYRKQLI